MIPPAQVTEIRRLFFAEHWRVGTIATQLGLHPDTIRRALATERFARPALPRPSQCDPDRPFLQETLQRSRRLSAFVLVLSWSRALHAVFPLDESLESFLRGHVEAFQALQGVPRAILYDNLRSAVLERRGDAIRVHPRLLELCGHYHFVPRPCAVAAAHEKGRGE